VLGKLPGVQWIERGGILREAFVGRGGGVELFPRVLDERLAEVRMSLPQELGALAFNEQADRTLVSLND
jgi:hypothetical protein